jgi:hypothetical protein
MVAIPSEHKIYSWKSATKLIHEAENIILGQNVVALN